MEYINRICRSHMPIIRIAYYTYWHNNVLHMNCSVAFFKSSHSWIQRTDQDPLHPCGDSLVLPHQTWTFAGFSHAMFHIQVSWLWDHIIFIFWIWVWHNQKNIDHSNCSDSTKQREVQVYICGLWFVWAGFFWLSFGELTIYSWLKVYDI